MNQRQRTILMLSAAVLAVTLIYPPFQFMGRSLGHQWIFSGTYSRAIIDPGQLMVQWVAIALITGILYLLSGSKNITREEKEKDTMFGIPFIKAIFIFSIPVLRIIRAFIWLILIWLSIGLIGALFSNENLNASGQYDIGKLFAYLIMKSAVALIFVGLFFLLRFAINTLHKKCYGTPHPDLVKKWSV